MREWEAGPTTEVRPMGATFRVTGSALDAARASAATPSSTRPQRPGTEKTRDELQPGLVRTGPAEPFASSNASTPAQRAAAATSSGGNRVSASSSTCEHSVAEIGRAHV